MIFLFEISDAPLVDVGIKVLRVHQLWYYLLLCSAYVLLCLLELFIPLSWHESLLLLLWSAFSDFAGAFFVFDDDFVLEDLEVDKAIGFLLCVICIGKH